MSNVPLSVLDLVPISSGSTARQALANSLDLAQQAERFGYRRYWFAEHHLNPGVAGAAPAVTIALVAAGTEHIRLGSAGVQLGHRTALSIVEEFGLIDALHPGRLDLGLGRSGVSVDRERLARKPQLAARAARHNELLQQPGAQTVDFREHVESILALLDGKFRSPDGQDVHANPGEGADLPVWVLGSSGGLSAKVAGERGLNFAASYHIAPSGVPDAVAAYREAFTPSEHLSKPYVAVSADVVVAEDDETAKELAAGYAPWVRSIRRAEGAIPFPTPEEAARFEWTDEDRAQVADRVQTQIAGSPATAVEKLHALREATQADELVITTITHAHADRVRSYELLARAWADS